MMTKNNIKLNMTDYKIRKQCGRSGLSEKDKIARIYALAHELHIKIGGAK